MSGGGIGRVASKAGDLAFKAFTAGLGVATIYLTATFSANVYTGLAWHKAQQKLGEEESQNNSSLDVAEGTEESQDQTK
ncbi:hypothetical protein MKW98_005909 [Papaver atlanticum]|uniref:Uncharacterized protein n=1 Tax=Papaver atlanticum TaxID=357466 RepID=A0AAD4XV53_9MAGN|nr:hypothetical protein MKW98_005909 [Papaver atlanticum]